MIFKKLLNPVDLEKLTDEDFILSGEFRLINETYNGWGKKPEFRQEGTNTYGSFDDLFTKAKFDQCYELIVQTPECLAVVGSGFLHQSQRGDVSFGNLGGFEGERVYYNLSPVWFNLLTEEYKPIVEGQVDLIFLKASPYNYIRDFERARFIA